MDALKWAIDDPVEQEFLQKSINVRVREESQKIARQKKLRRRAFVATIAAGIALLAAVFAIYAYFKAEKQSLIALQQQKIATARWLASESNAAIGRYPQRAILLAVEAIKASEIEDFRLPAPEQALRNALSATSGYGIAGRESPVDAIAISGDSRWLVTAGADKTARLWDLTAEDPSQTAVVLRGHDNLVLAVAISADNRWLVTAGVDKTARLWALRVDELINTARRVTGRNLNHKEWEQYFQGEEYRKTFVDLPEGL
jgi:hypothetical protein